MRPSTPDPELRLLLTYLGIQRDHVLAILDGLDEDALRRPVLPSGWSCLGLVRHLALDVERFWFGGILAGSPAVIAGLAEIGDGAWLVDPETRPETVFDLYRREIAAANAAILATTPDALAGYWPESLFGDRPRQSARQTILHVMTETAAHAGHLDVVRELIDGRRWLVLTGTSG